MWADKFFIIYALSRNINGTLLALTFEPDVVETSDWLHAVPYQKPHHGSVSYHMLSARGVFAFLMIYNRCFCIFYRFVLCQDQY